MEVGFGETQGRKQSPRLPRVLILVAVEDGLGGQLAGCKALTIRGLNPCFSGSRFRSRYGRNESHAFVFVLILVVVEDGLGDTQKTH